MKLVGATSCIQFDSTSHHGIAGTYRPEVSFAAKCPPSLLRLSPPESCPGDATERLGGEPDGLAGVGQLAWQTVRRGPGATAQHARARWDVWLDGHTGEGRCRHRIRERALVLSCGVTLLSISGSAERLSGARRGT